MQHRWNEEEVIYLIRGYAERQVLWNPDHPDYHNKVVKNEEWFRLAENLGVDDEEVRRKIASLLASNRRERNHQRRAENKGKVYESRWFAFHEFDFLNRIKRKRNNESEASNSEAEGEANEAEGDEYTPKPLRRERKVLRIIDCRPTPSKGVEEDPEVSIRTVCGQPAAPSSLEADEIKSFCSFLSSKIMRYSATTRQGVQHAIYDILVRADKGVFEAEDLLEQQFLEQNGAD